MQHSKFIWFCLMIFIHLSSSSQSLDSLFQLAVDHNVALKAVALEYKAIQAQTDQVNPIPNPQVGVGVPVLRPETRLGPQIINVSASQMFPWFGTGSAKKEVVIQMSRAKYEEILVLKLDLFYQIETAYYQLHYLQKAERFLSDNIENYKTLASIAQTQVEVGKGSIADVLRIQMKSNELEVKIKQFSNDRTALFAKINKVIDRPLDQQWKITDTTNYLLVNYDLESYKAKLAQHPTVNQINHKITASNSRLAVNNLIRKPMIGVGLNYSLVDPRIDANPVGNGRDILIPSVMFSIPIYQKKYQAIQAEEKLKQEAMGLKKYDLQQQMITRIIGYKKDYDNALLSLNLAQDDLKKAHQIYRILLTKYSHDGTHIDQLLVAQNDILRLQLNAAYSQLEMGLAKAGIKQLINY